MCVQSREHRYRVTPGGFTHVLNEHLSLMQPGVHAADFGLQLLGNAYRDELDRLWADYRDKRQR